MANLRTNNLSGEGGRNAYRGSVFFNGEDKTYLYLASGALISGTGFGTGDFTVEFWINQGVNASDYTNLISLYASTTTDRFQIAIHSSTIQVYTATGSWADTGYAPTSGVYEHIVFQRDYSGNTLKMYANGHEKWSASNNHDYNEVFETYIGDYTSAAYKTFQGYLSNIRICMGHLVYSSNYFTPPTSPLTVHYNSDNDKTILLCCQDSDDPTQEATGKTITAYGEVDFSHNSDNLVKNGNFDASATEEWTLTGGTAALSTGQSGTFGDGNHLLLTASSSSAYLKQAITTKIGRTYLTDGQSNGGDASFISTSTSESDYVISDIRGGKTFVATQTTYYVILRANTGGGNFDTISVYEQKVPTPPKVIPPFGVDAGNRFGGAISMNSSAWMYFPTGRTEERGRGRAVIAGGVTHTPSPNSYMTRIDFFNITTTGNTLFFGDLSFGSRTPKGMVSSTTRAVYAGGMGPSSEVATNSMSFITIATTGNGTDYGDLTAAGRQSEGCSNNTRGIYFSGQNDSPSSNTNNNIIEFITTASTGNATDFGDQTNGRDGGGACQSTTRGVYAGGDPSPYTNTIDYITIATIGNAADFGDLTLARTGATGCSNSVRGLFMSGRVAPTNYNTIEYITIATTGNSVDFGDLSYVRIQASAAANKIRGVLIGGNPGSSPNNYTEMSQVTIDTTGNATDFGDCFEARTRGSVSDSHGGLS